ncbi:MAG: hypothetical protein ACOYZ8_18825 [Chloroflexota bacterium]
MKEDAVRRVMSRGITWVAVIYIVLSFAYQSWAFLFDKTGFSKVETISLHPCYEIRLRLPDQIPLSTLSITENARPITIWGWKKQDPICMFYDDEIMANLNNQGKLVFIDANNAETSSSFVIQMGDSEAQASRQSISVYVPLTDPSIERVTLNMELLNDNIAHPESYPLDVESLLRYGVFEFLDIFLGTTTFTLITAVLALSKFYFDQQERRRASIRELEGALDKLGLLKERIGMDVINLYPRAQELGGLFLQKLTGTFEVLREQYRSGDVWSHSLRREIVARWRQADFEKWLWNITEVLQFPTTKQDVENLTWFSEWLRSPVESKINAEILEKTLRVFQIVGMSGRDAIVRKVAEILNGHKISNQVEKLFREQWYEWGRAAGRYLLRHLINQDLQSKLKEWDTQQPLPPNRLGQPLWPWPNRIRFQIPPAFETQLPDPSELSYPFGPIAAQDDPRLPLPSPGFRQEKGGKWVGGMFWGKHPIWAESIAQPQSAIYLSDRGMGTTTFIWMGRHERRFWGIKPSLSLYFDLAGIASADKIWGGLEAGLVDSLLVSLTEDPYWLLDAPSAVQERIGSFLISCYGDTTRLLKSMEEWGLPAHEQMLVADMLIGVETFRPYQEKDLHRVLADVLDCMADAVRDRLDDERFDCYLWIEIKDSPSLQDWLALFESLGLGPMGVLKIFSTGPEAKQPEKTKLPMFRIDWKKDNLYMLLEHRIRQSWNETTWGRFLPGVKPMDLVEKAASPRDLIRLGNEALFRGSHSRGD